MEKTHTGGKRPRTGFSVFEKAHTSPPYGFLPSADIGQVVYWDLSQGLKIRGFQNYDAAFRVSLFAKLELGFFGGGGGELRVSSVFSAVFVRFFACPNFAFRRLRLVQKNGQPMRDPEISQKHGNTLFLSGNENAKLGVETEKSRFLLQIVIKGFGN